MKIIAMLLIIGIGFVVWALLRTSTEAEEAAHEMPCPYPGCPALSQGPYCADHQRVNEIKERREEDKAMIDTETDEDYYVDC